MQQALDHGSKITGVTVHFVDEGVDSGPIIMQRPVPVAPSRDWEELEEAIHATEHALLPEAIRLIAAGRIRVDDRNPRLVRIDPETDGLMALPRPVVDSPPCRPPPPRSLPSPPASRCRFAGR